MLPATYFGGKGQASTVRRIVNVMPPHDYYLEPFLGRGRILEAKRPAERASFGWELDPRMAAAWNATARPGLIVGNSDGIDGAGRTIATLIASGVAPERVLVYCDPPYLMETRRNAQRVYFREWTADDHAAFLWWVCSLGVRVIVSHLPCIQYATALDGWHTFTFTNKIRTGLQLEQLWMNYTPGTDLHDYRYIGSNFRERERFKRQFGILCKRFAALPPAARVAAINLLEARNLGDG